VFLLLKNTILIADEKNKDASKPYQNLTENSVLIEGDSLESILDRKLRATGNAFILKGNQSITADFIEYDQISKSSMQKVKLKSHFKGQSIYNS